MLPSDRKAFGELIAGMFAYHRVPLSDGIIRMYWNGCQRWDMEQVTRAINQLTQDAEAGRFPAKIGDLTRVLEGTHTDRSMIAWGKVLEAMGSIGAYQDVIFDDPAIHAAVLDAGNWPKLCRTPTDELGYVQAAFCKAHRAYTGRGTFDYPRLLSGERDPDAEYTAKGLPPPRPALVGDPHGCARVYTQGAAAGKAGITFKSLGALVALMPPRPSAQDDNLNLENRA